MTPEPIDISGAKTRPPRGEGRPKIKPKGDDGAQATPAEDFAQAAKPRQGKDRKLQDGLRDLYVQAGLIVDMGHIPLGKPGLHVAAVNIITRAPTMAEEWMDLADQNPAVKEALNRFLSGTSLVGVVMAHAFLAIPVVAAMGVNVPTMAVLASLSPEAQAEYAKLAAEAMAAATANGNGATP